MDGASGSAGEGAEDPAALGEGVGWISGGGEEVGGCAEDGDVCGGDSGVSRYAGEDWEGAWVDVVGFEKEVREWVFGGVFWVSGCGIGRWWWAMIS